MGLPLLMAHILENVRGKKVELNELKYQNHVSHKIVVMAKHVHIVNHNSFLFLNHRSDFSTSECWWWCKVELDLLCLSYAKVDDMLLLGFCLC